MTKSTSRRYVKCATLKFMPVWARFSVGELVVAGRGVGIAGPNRRRDRAGSPAHAPSKLG